MGFHQQLVQLLHPAAHQAGDFRLDVGLVELRQLGGIGADDVCTRASELSLICTLNSALVPLKAFISTFSIFRRTSVLKLSRGT